MLIRREAFFAVGGYTEERGLSWEDWELLIRLSVRGFDLDVVPRTLQLYGVTPEGASRTTDSYDNRMRILRAYFDGQPDWVQRIIRDVALSGLFSTYDSMRNATLVRQENDRLRQSLQQAMKQALQLSMDINRLKRENAKKGA